MAYDVVFSEAAQLDRDDIVSRLARRLRNPVAAARFLDGLDHVVDNLETMPRMYAPFDEEGIGLRGYRRATFMGYVALYRVDKDEVKIVRIFHTRQDYARLV